LIWIDLEMTGLVPERDLIIEIATIVTDADLKTIAEGPVFAISQPEQALLDMDEWNTRQHGSSGLTQRVRESLVSVEQAERETIAFLQKHLEAGHSPMCGNSICQDRRFLARYMPRLEAFFHYRNLDVSSLKELARRWKPSVLEGMKKSSNHLAMDDIRDSIEELRYYRSKLFDL
ncbi:MAG: oligoribonuclease, partial [Pseudomonadales bacterium]